MGSASNAAQGHRPNQEWNPFGSGGGAVNKYDPLGQLLDKYNPYVRSAKKKEEALRNMDKDAAGMPKAPSFVDENGVLKSQYSMNAGNYDLGQKYTDALGQRAMSKGPSSWALMQNQGIDQQTAALRDQNASDSAAAYGQGVSNLAQTGGLDSGARERLSGGAGLAQLQGNQAISRQGSMAKTQTGIEDEQQKLGILQNLPGMLGNQAAFKANIDSKNIDRATNSQMYNYGEQMKAFTGDKMARATIANSGKK